MSETNFSKAKSAFEKALTIEQFNLTDASEAIEFKDIKEMNFCLETISSSVAELEAKLAAALRIAADDDASEVNEIKSWRSEQKKGIHSMKSMIKTLEYEIRYIDQETERMNIAKRRQFEDEERSREEKWLSRKLELQHSSFTGGYQPADSSHSDTHSSDLQEKDSGTTDENHTSSSNQQRGKPTNPVDLVDKLPNPPAGFTGSSANAPPEDTHTSSSQFQQSVVSTNVPPSNESTLNPERSIDQPLQDNSQTSENSVVTSQPIVLPPPIVTNPSNPTSKTPMRANQSDPMMNQMLQMINIQQQMLQNQINSKPTNQDSDFVKSVKLQPYTITPFYGEYRDYVRFWNQFSGEIDGRKNLAEISKFNYLLELCKGKPKEDILGLPHTEAGYQEAKAILERKYGKNSKVKREVLRELEELESISYSSSNRLEKCHRFYNKLSRTVRTLDTMGALRESQNSVFLLMDKLGPIREYLIQKDDDWEDWSLQDLVDNLERYVERNPLSSTKDDRNNNRDSHRDRRNNEHGIMGKGAQKCVYCESDEHQSYQCDKVLDVASRREVLNKLKACYNCTSTSHQVAKCKSTRKCYHCGQKHHSSLCTKPQSTMGDSSEKKDEESNKTNDKNYSNYSGAAIHPSALVHVENLEARLVVDTLSGSSYIGSDLISTLNLKPKRKERRSIEQMFGTVDKVVEVYEVMIASKSDSFKMKIECINAERDVITHLPNPNIEKLKRAQPRLRKIRFSEEETKDELLPVHILLGVKDYNQIRLSEAPIIGEKPDFPVAEQTKLGWILFGSETAQTGREFCHFTMSGKQQFEQLCNTDVLGLKDRAEEDLFNHDTFKEQIKLDSSGKYVTRLPWKTDEVQLPNNKALAIGRLKSTVKKLEKLEKIEQYDAIMQEQISLGMLIPVTEKSTSASIHYVPHHPVIKEESETTPLRIVYDCSAKPNKSDPSLNECLETGPTLQPHLFDVLLRNRFRKFCVTGDIKKAFHQICLRPEDCDVQRVLWFNNLQDREIQEYCFTRVIFGATSSPYILGATIEKHLDDHSDGISEATLKSLKENTYVDDVQGGGDNTKDVHNFREEASQLLQNGGFELHKWHSNVPECDSENGDPQTKVLGITWHKQNDTLSVCAQIQPSDILTKRKVLSAINSVYDVLGWVSPFMITAKLIFSEICSGEYHWDQQLPPEITSRWNKWVQALEVHNQVTVPRSLCTKTGSVFQLHGFGDASKSGVCAAIYAVEFNMGQPISQNLLVAKSRISPKETSIPRLELIAAHTLSKLQHNVNTALKDVPIMENHFWSDSTTVLHWLADQGKYSVFVKNRVKQINDLSNGNWRHVPTSDNPADLGTRAKNPTQLEDLWMKGPKWLSEPQSQPTQPEIVETEESRSEQKALKQQERSMMAATEPTIDPGFMQKLLERFNYQKLLRITAWIKRFKTNCLGNREKGPLKSEEISSAEFMWIKLTQLHQGVNQKMDVIKNDDGITVVNSRIPGYRPILLPQRGEFVRRLIEEYHQQTCHGGVASTMTKIRERFWIPKLRTAVKGVIHNCNLCRQHRKQRMQTPVTSDLPDCRAEFTRPFAAVGVDFAGPLYCKIAVKEPNRRGRTPKRKQMIETEKVYFGIFSCAATRAVHISLCKDMTAKEFQRVFKEFVARRGKPTIVISDNAKTFQATSEWLETLQKDDEMGNFLARQNIKWRFNMSRAPWWGGFYERLIGIVKTSLSKVVGKSLLSFEELQEALIDVECFMNNRPLMYVGEECDQPVLTPNILMQGIPASFLEEDLEKVNYMDEDKLVTKRMIYLQKTREHLKKRWKNEYLHALQERHERHSAQNQRNFQPGSVVMTTDSLTSLKSRWTLGKVIGVIHGKDGVVRGLKIRSSSGYVIERPLQLVRDLEISGSGSESDQSLQESKNDRSPTKRCQPTRKAKEAAIKKIEDTVTQEKEE